MMNDKQPATAADPVVTQDTRPSSVTGDGQTLIAPGAGYVTAAPAPAAEDPEDIMRRAMADIEAAKAAKKKRDAKLRAEAKAAKDEQRKRDQARKRKEADERAAEKARRKKEAAERRAAEKKEAAERRAAEKERKAKEKEERRAREETERRARDEQRALDKASRQRSAAHRGGPFRRDRRPPRADERPSRPVTYERPRGCSQDALGFMAVYDGEQAVIRVEPELWSMTLQFDDTSFQSAREETQGDIYRQWSEILATFDDGACAKVQIVCRALSPETFKRAITKPLVEGAPDVENEWRVHINRIIEGRVDTTRQNVVRERYLTISVNAPTREKAAPALSRLAESCRRQLRAIGVQSHVLKPDEWLDLVDSLTNPYNRKPGGVHLSDLAQGMGLRALDLVAPPDFTRSKDRKRCSWGRAYGQALYVRDWASTVRTDMLSSLAELPINQVITIDLDPWSQADAIDVVEGKLTDVKVETTDYYMRHSSVFALSEEMLPTDLQDATKTLMGYRDDLVKRDQRMYDVAVMFLTWAESEEGVDENVAQMRDVLSNFNVRIEPLDSCQGQGFETSMPTGTCTIPYRTPRTTAPAAALIPFTSSELMDLTPSAMWVGTNQVSKNFVSVDRLRMNAANGFILGKTGRGKSVFAKWAILQSYLSDAEAQFVVLDPEHEYTELARHLGGEVVKIGGVGTNHINPFDLVGKDNDDWTWKVDAIISEVEMMTKGLTELEMSILDQCITEVYHGFLETRDPGDVPTLEDLHDALTRHPNAAGAQLAETIDRYVHGQASLFNHRTDVETDRRLVVYDLSETPENLKSLALFILLGETWNLTVRNRWAGRRTWVYVDEMQLLLENVHAVEYLDSYYTRARKYGAIPTCITQNIERLVLHEKTRLMLANSDFLVILGQSATDARTLGNIVELSDANVDIVRTAMPGEGLLIVEGATIIPFDAHIPEDSEVYRLVTTKPTDLATKGGAA